MLELIIVRHGETDSNKLGTYLGWTDRELNAEGLRQAEKARERLKSEKIDRIIASPLGRAAKTAEVINQSHGLEIVYDEDLKEKNFGVWDDLTYAEITQKYPAEHEMWLKDQLNYCVEGGESTLESYQRITRFTDRLLSRYSEGTVLIVTHLGSIRKMVAYLLGMGIEGFWRFKFDNCSITRIQVTDGYSFLVQSNS